MRAPALDVFQVAHICSSAHQRRATATLHSSSHTLLTWWLKRCLCTEGVRSFYLHHPSATRYPTSLEGGAFSSLTVLLRIGVDSAVHLVADRQACSLQTRAKTGSCAPAERQQGMTMRRRPRAATGTWCTCSTPRRPRRPGSGCCSSWCPHGRAWSARWRCGPEPLNIPESSRKGFGLVGELHGWWLQHATAGSTLQDLPEGKVMLIMKHTSSPAAKMQLASSCRAHPSFRGTMHCNADGGASRDTATKPLQCGWQIKPSILPQVHMRGQQRSLPAHGAPCR